MRFLALLALLVVTSVARAEDPAAASFPQFCDEWADKLAARERDNVAHIQWEAEDGVVKGDYLGYTREHTCLTKIGTQSTPVGKIIYREIKYEKVGSTVEEAEQTEARAVDVTEITEIFRYAGGKWLY